MVTYEIQEGAAGENDDNPCHLLSPLVNNFVVNNFGERMEGEIYPKALTFPVDKLLLERELVQICTPGGQGRRISICVPSSGYFACQAFGELAC